MKEIVDFFKFLFDTSDWPPRWYCGNWTDFHGWLYIISDLLIWAAYFTAPVLIIKYISKKHDARFVKLYFLFAAFILACGTTHFFDAVTFWVPMYRFNAFVRLITAVVSWITVLTLIKYLPEAFSLRSNAELEKEIAQRKMAEEALLASEKRFKSIVQEGGDLMGILDEEGNFVYVSPSTISIIGIAPEAFIGKNAFSLIHPDDLERVKMCFSRLQTEKRVELEAFRFLYKENDYRWTETVLTNLLEDPAIRGIVANSRDVTERIKKEEIIKQRNAELNKIFDYSRDIICAIDEEGRFAKVSKASITTLGYTPEELVGKRYSHFVAEEDVFQTNKIAEEIMSGHPVSDFENTYYHKDGSRVPLIWSARWDEQDELMYGIARNATEKVRLEKTIQIEQERFSRMFTEAPLSMCILKGPEHEFVDTNELYSTLTGRRNVKGKTAREVFPELNNQGYFGWLDQVYQTGKTYSGQETPLVVDREGNGQLTMRYINFIYQPYFDNKGKVEGIFYFGIDVTEQVEMRKKLEQSEKRFRSLIENSHDILVLVDENGLRKYVSPAFERTLGYDPSEAIGARCIEKVHPDDAARMCAVLEKVYESPGVTFYASARYKHKEGHYVWLDGSITNLLHIEEVNALVYNYKDIDEKKKAEEEKELIFKINNAFTQRSSLRDSLGAVLQELCSFTQADGAEAWMTSIDSKEFDLVSNYSKHPLSEPPARNVFSNKDDIPRKLLETKTPLVIGDIQGCEICLRKAFAKANGYHSVTIIPVLFNEEVIALISLFNYEAGKKGFVTLGENIFIQLASEIQRKKTEEELDRFFDLSGDILCIAGDGYFKKVNPAFTKVLGYNEQELLSTPFMNLIHPDDREISIEGIETIRKGKEIFNFENRYISKEGKVKHLVWTVTPTQENLMFAVAKDVTEIRKAERKAESYSRRISVILESITDAFFALDADFTVTYWNNQAAKLLGISCENILGKHLWDVFPEAVSLKFYSQYNEALTKNKSVRFEEYYHPLKVWFDVSAYPSDEGLSIYFRDITESKKTYQHLVKTEADVRNFARQLNTVLEEDRSNIAREIHDEFGQQLAGIKMSISSLKKQIKGDESIQQKLADIMQDVDVTMQSLRNFATELRPGILDTMGLIPSLEWLAREFEKKSGITCYVDINGSEREFERNFSTCYFRICQEALTNVLKHAKASHVAILVYEDEGYLVLEVIDDGIGIVEDKIQNPFSMGLLGMKERANLIGGSLLIQEGAFKGTIVQLKARIHAD